MRPLLLLFALPPASPFVPLARPGRAAARPLPAAGAGQEATLALAGQVSNLHKRGDHAGVLRLLKQVEAQAATDASALTPSLVEHGLLSCCQKREWNRALRLFERSRAAGNLSITPRAWRAASCGTRGSSRRPPSMPAGGEEGRGKKARTRRRRRNMRGG